MIYKDSGKKIWQLAEFRKLICYYIKSYNRYPWITLGTLERGENVSDVPSLNVRIYATEFALLKKAILEFCDYMQNEKLPYKPTEIVPVDITIPSRGLYKESFIVDSSRSNAWLLLRLGKNLEERVELLTVMEKERLFPIHLAFHFDDISFVRKLMNELDVYFNNQRAIVGKIGLLEKRFTEGSLSHVCETDEETKTFRKSVRCERVNESPIFSNTSPFRLATLMNVIAPGEMLF